jgi:hypothetical protein
MPRRKKVRARRAVAKVTPPPAIAPPPPTEYATWKAELTPREQRIDEVVQLMAGGHWMAGVSHRQLAQRWGLTPGTVEHIALEANRILRLNFRTDADGRRDATALVLQTFEVIRVKAMVMNSAGGLRVALEATEALGRYLGLEPPKRVALADDRDEFKGLSDADVEAIAEGKLGHASDVGAEPDDIH